MCTQYTCVHILADTHVLTQQCTPSTHSMRTSPVTPPPLYTQLHVVLSPHLELHDTLTWTPLTTTPMQYATQVAQELGLPWVCTKRIAHALSAALNDVKTEGENDAMGVCVCMYFAVCLECGDVFCVHSCTPPSTPPTGPHQHTGPLPGPHPPPTTPLPTRSTHTSTHTAGLATRIYAGWCKNSSSGWAGWWGWYGGFCQPGWEPTATTTATAAAQWAAADRVGDTTTGI